MTHIADCMRSDIGLGLNNLIAKGLYDRTSDHPISSASLTEKSPHSADATDSPKYRIWPSYRHASVSGARDTDKSEALIAGRSVSATGHRPETRLRASRRTSSNPPKPQDAIAIHSRRKVPIQEVSTMSTVQEWNMDSRRANSYFLSHSSALTRGSATLPRVQPPLRSAPKPPLRERASSAPGDVAEHLLCLSSPRVSKVMEDVELLPATVYSADADSQLPVYERISKDSIFASFLAPLEIPDYESFTDSLLITKNSDSGDISDIPPPVPPKSPKLDKIQSPPSRAKISTMPTDVSSYTLVDSSRSPSPNSTKQRRRNSPERASRQVDIAAASRPRHMQSHSFESNIQDSSKRAAPTYRQNSTLPLVFRAPCATLGSAAPDSSSIAQTCMGAVVNSEALGSWDVGMLMKELRDLDEQHDQLRTTQNSLRCSRRTLRGRLVTYLKSPRITTFSRKSILRREEALAELETAIDDVSFNLEQIENRRTLVRQRLLEHIGASLALGRKGRSPSNEDHTPPQSPGSLQWIIRRKPDNLETADIAHDNTIEALLQGVEKLMRPDIIPSSA